MVQVPAVLRALTNKLLVMNCNISPTRYDVAIKKMLHNALADDGMDMIDSHGRPVVRLHRTFVSGTSHYHRETGPLLYRFAVAPPLVIFLRIWL